MRVLRLLGDQLSGLPPPHRRTGAGLSQPAAGRPRTLPTIQLGAMDLGSDRGNRVRGRVVAARVERDGDAADAGLSLNPTDYGEYAKRDRDCARGRRIIGYFTDLKSAARDGKKSSL